MSPLAKVGVVAAGVVLAAAVVSPGVYHVAQAFGDRAPWLAGFPFHRFFSRTVQVFAVAGAVLLAWWLGIRDLRALGLHPNPQRWRDLAAGVVAALVPVVALGAAYLAFDLWRIRKDLPWEGLVRIFPTAAAVSLVEEFLFRGVLLGLAVRAFGALRGVLGVSALFALVHFVRPRRVGTGTVDWASGFHEAWGALSGWPAWPLWAYGFATLFLAGLLLAWLTLRTRSLWAAIGLHAGWILGQQGLNWLAKFRVQPPEAMLPWVGPSVVSGVVPTGLLPLAALALAGVVLFLYVGRRHRP